MSDSSSNQTTEIVCANCDGEGWVCEDHPEVPWREGDGCCGGAGMLCSCSSIEDGTDYKTTAMGLNATLSLVSKAASAVLHNRKYSKSEKTKKGLSLVQMPK